MTDNPPHQHARDKTQRVESEAARGWNAEQRHGRQRDESENKTEQAS